MSEDDIRLLEDEVVRWTQKAKNAPLDCMRDRYLRIAEDMRGLLADGLMLDVGIEELCK